MPTPPTDWIHLRAFTFPCILGLLEWEQTRPQTLDVEASLNLDLAGAAGGDLAASVNYAEVLEDLQFIAEHGRWRLLESMAAAMARHVLAPPAPGEARAQVHTVRLRLAKPDVFGGRAVPQIELVRSHPWGPEEPLAWPMASGVHVATLQVTPESAAYRVRLAPGAAWQLPGDAALKTVAGAPATEAGPLPAEGARVPSGAWVRNPGPGDCWLLAVAHPPLRAPC